MHAPLSLLGLVRASLSLVLLFVVISILVVLVLTAWVPLAAARIAGKAFR